MGRLDGKVALITGAGRGIGKAIAGKLAGEGARLVVNDLDAESCESVTNAIIAAGGDAIACPGSIVDNDFADRFVSAAVDGFGGLDIIVNNAGYTWDNVIQKMGDEQWDAMLDVHMTAPFRILRAASEFIREAAKKERADGREVFRKIVNISSTSGIYGNAGQVNYSGAKAGIVGMTLALAKEWGRYSVNVNCVAFGLIHTRLNQPLGEDSAQIDIEGHSIPVGVRAESLAMLKQVIPLGRGGTPEEAAGAVFLFCTPESNYISGQVVVCGGGLRL